MKEVFDYTKEKMILTSWDYSRLSENEDNTFTPAFIKTLSIPYQAVNQDNTFLNGRIYMLNSTSIVNAFPSSIVVIDPNEGKIENIIELYGSHRTAEIEGLDWYLDDDTYKLMFTNSSGYFYDITF